MNRQELIDKARDIVNKDVIKGFTADFLKMAANDLENQKRFETYLKNISDQAWDPQSERNTILAYSQELVDIVKQLFPKEIESSQLDENRLQDIAKKNDKKGYYDTNDFISVLKKELEMGIEVEMEHTDDKKKAEKIALDHLEEIPDYYTRLKKMEKDAIKKKISESFDSNKRDRASILRDLNNTPAKIEIHKVPLGGITRVKISLGGAIARVEFYQDHGEEPMGIKGIPKWAKKELYLENIYREDNSIKGAGLIVLKNFFEFAKRNKVDIITLKRADFSDEKLENYYRTLGFVNSESDDPAEMYLDFRTDEPLKIISMLIEKMISDEEKKSNDIKEGIKNKLRESFVINEAKEHTNDEIVDFNEIDLQHEYNKLNDLLFDGNLQPVTMLWNKRKGAHGVVKAERRRSTGQIRILSLSLSQFLKVPYKFFKDVLAHEMIHVYWLQQGTNAKHGYLFLQEMDRINSMGLGFNVSVRSDSSETAKFEMSPDLVKEGIELVFLLLQTDREKNMLSVMKYNTYKSEAAKIGNIYKFQVAKKGKYKFAEGKFYLSTNPALQKQRIQRAFGGGVSYVKIDETIVNELLKDAKFLSHFKIVNGDADWNGPDQPNPPQPDKPRPRKPKHNFPFDFNL